MDRMKAKTRVGGHVNGKQLLKGYVKGNIHEYL